MTRKVKFNIETLKGKPSIPDEVIEAIRKDLMKGMKQRVIAKRYGVSQSFVSFVKNNRHRVSNEH